MSISWYASSRSCRVTAKEKSTEHTPSRTQAADIEAPARLPQTPTIWMKTENFFSTVHQQIGSLAANIFQKADGSIETKCDWREAEAQKAAIAVLCGIASVVEEGSTLRLLCGQHNILHAFPPFENWFWKKWQPAGFKKKMDWFPLYLILTDRRVTIMGCDPKTRQDFEYLHSELPRSIRTAQVLDTRGRA